MRVCAYENVIAAVVVSLTTTTTTHHLLSSEESYQIAAMRRKKADDYKKLKLEKELKDKEDRCNAIKKGGFVDFTCFVSAVSRVHRITS